MDNTADTQPQTAENPSGQPGRTLGVGTADDNPSEPAAEQSEREQQFKQAQTERD